jgi:hypothetical protein
MNFQQIKETLGIMDGQYQAKTEITAIVKRVKDVEFSKKGKKGQSLCIELNGEEDWVKFTGKGVEEYPLDTTAVGRPYIFLVWPFRPEQSPKTYLYCWVQRQSPQGGYQAPPSAPQTHQEPLQSINPNIQAQFIALAERFIEAIEYVVHGTVPAERPTQPSGPNPDWVGEDPTPPDDSDIPF